MAKDYYKILGVDKDASDEEIKKAYHRLAHQYHPDKSGGNETKFKEINEAYQILSSKEKRNQYDQFGNVFDGSPGQNPFNGFGFDPSHFEDLGNISDIFDAFFEGLGAKKRKTYQRGSDIEITQEISLEDVFSGVKKLLKIRTHIACEVCAGAGYFADAGLTTCETCDGRGEIKETRNTFFGGFSQVRTCGKCFGRGQVPNKPCSACRGAGRKIGDRELAIDIAPGVGDGQLLKIVGGGEIGERGAGRGDLYARIKVKPHKIFERKNNDLIIKQDISLIDVLLGTRVEISDISGEKLHVEIPAGFNLKEKLRISGHGMIKFGGFGRGDLYVDWQIKTPKKLSGKAKKILEDLQKEGF